MKRWTLIIIEYIITAPFDIWRLRRFGLRNAIVWSWGATHAYDREPFTGPRWGRP